MGRRYAAAFVVLLLTVSLAGCGGRAEPASLRIGVLPILDTLPMYVADAEGAFAKRDVAVEFVTAASAAERDQLFQAGEIDGFITDLVALALYNRDAARVVAVRYAMTPTPEFAQFRVMAAGQAGIDSPDQLAGVEIGVSEGTVIEYVTHRMLQAEGVPPAEIVTLAVPKIPERMALLGSGELSAATLPEPLASLAMMDGAMVVVDDTDHLDISCSVYAFRNELVEGRPDALRGFLAAVSEASELINADKGRWSGLLSEKSLVPQPLMGSYELPDYPGDQVPTETQFDDAVLWLQETGRLAEVPAYADSVDASFLP